MTTPRKLLALLLGGAPLLLASADALAWVPLDQGLPRWANMPVTYKINQATIPPSISGIGVARVDAGFASWAGPACTFFQTSNTGNTNASYNYQDGQNVIRWITNSWPQQLGDVNSVIGVTMPVWDNNYDIFDADIVFNDVGFNWNDTGTNGNVDTQSIATHEEGHFLGLDHTNAGGATMEAFYGGGTSLRTLAQDDIDGVCALYPAGGTAASSGSGGGGDCQTCVNSVNDPGGACSSQVNACINNQACIDLYNCLGNCSTQACVDNCASQYQSGINDLNNMYDCWCTACSTECATECGGSSGSTTGSTTSGNSGSTTSGPGSTTGAGTTSGDATTGSGAGGAGATGVGGSGSGSNGSTTSGGSDPDPNANGADPDSEGGCAMGGAPAGLGALLLFSAFGGMAARRRRRRR